MNKSDQYFPHDYNASNDLKVVAFISECGLAGYGFYWVVIERLHKEESCQLPKKNYVYKALAEQMSTSVEQIKQYVEQATDCELFVENDEFIISERVLKNMNKRQDISEKRSQAGKISALKRTSVEQVLTSVEQNSTKERKGKEIKEKEIKEIKELPPLPPDTEIKEYFFKVISDQAIALDKTINDIDKDKAIVEYIKCLAFCKEKHKTTKKKSYNWKNQVNSWVDITKYKVSQYKKTEITQPPAPVPLAHKQLPRTDKYAEIAQFNTCKEVIAFWYANWISEGVNVESMLDYMNSKSNDWSDTRQNILEIWNWGKQIRCHHQIREDFQSKDKRVGLVI